MDRITLLYCPFPTHAAAVHAARHLVTEGLAACANILAPGTAFYLWQGTLQYDEEIPLLIKTDAARLPAAAEAIRALHPHETPCILHWETHAQPDYAEWVHQSTKEVASPKDMQ